MIFLVVIFMVAGTYASNSQEQSNQNTASSIDPKHQQTKRGTEDDQQTESIGMNIMY